MREHRHADRDEGHNEDDLVVRQSTLLHEQEREDDGREPAWPNQPRNDHGRLQAPVPIIAMPTGSHPNQREAEHAYRGGQVALSTAGTSSTAPKMTKVAQRATRLSRR